jgi:hypothetical protein
VLMINQQLSLVRSHASLKAWVLMCDALMHLCSIGALHSLPLLTDAMDLALCAVDLVCDMDIDAASTPTPLPEKVLDDTNRAALIAWALFELPAQSAPAPHALVLFTMLDMCRSLSNIHSRLQPHTRNDLCQLITYTCVMSARVLEHAPSLASVAWPAVFSVLSGAGVSPWGLLAIPTLQLRAQQANGGMTVREVLSDAEDGEEEGREARGVAQAPKTLSLPLLPLSLAAHALLSAHDCAQFLPSIIAYDITSNISVTHFRSALNVGEFSLH